MSVTQFAELVILALNNIQRRNRLGSKKVEYVVVVAHRDGLIILRYFKIWHHGLLATVV